MTRPAIIIGLGGTGQWVLTYLKKDLMENNGGRMPPEVKLIALDTTSSKDAHVEQAGGDEEAAQVGGVALDLNEGEFLHLGGNIEETVHKVAVGKLPHIGSWLQAQTYIRTLPSHIYQLSEGAAKMRPFGRMALFYDMAATAQSKIWNGISDAMADLRNIVKEKRTLDVLVIGSIAGGTGAGMLIDVAHLVRQLGQEEVGGGAHVRGDEFRVTGFVVLPGAFARVPGGDDREMRARAFATLRELGRFLTVFGDVKYPMCVNPAEPRFCGEATKRLFDICYLIDPQREEHSLRAVEPKYGIFPSIAEAVSVLLDNEAGNIYSQHIVNTSEKIKASHVKESVALYSGLGAYTIILPVYYLQEFSAHRFALDLLDILLAPEIDEADPNRPKSLAPNRNKEAGASEPGSNLVEQFMTEHERKGIKNTLFTTAIWDIHLKGGSRNERLIEDHAAAPGGWMHHFAPPVEDKELVELRNDVQKMWETKVSNKVLSSKVYGDTPSSGYYRIEKEVRQFKDKYLGIKRRDGSVSGGVFREAIAKWGQIHLNRFHRLLNLRVEEILNGLSATDPVKSKGGKLGYLQDFLKALAIQLDDFENFMEDVRALRSRWKLLSNQELRVNQYRQQMLDKREKTIWPTSGPRPVAYNAQVKYLGEEDRLMHLQKLELLQDQVVEVASQMRNYTQQVQAVVDSWAKSLALGDEREEGTYRALLNSQDDLNARFAKEKAIEVYKLETDKAHQNKLYKKYAGDHLARQLGMWRWQVGEPEDNFELSLAYFPASADEAEFTLWRKPPQARKRVSEYNKGVLLTLSRRIFDKMKIEEKIALHLMDRYAEHELSQILVENSKPLLGYSHTGAGERQTANFLRIKHGFQADDEAYYQKVRHQMGAKTGAKDANLQVVQSSNPHKCTAIYTVDILREDSLTSYDLCFKAYQEFSDDRRLLHCFPAEVSAVKYEQRLVSELHQSYRLFKPRIVYVLEYEERVRQFFLCHVYGYVILATNDETRKNYYQFELPEIEGEMVVYGETEIHLTPQVRGEPDFLIALENFVFKQGDIRPGVARAIEPSHLREALNQAQEEVGDWQNNIDEIEDYLKNKRGMALRLQNSQDQSHRDLSALMRLMLKDEIGRLKVNWEAEQKKQERKARKQEREERRQAQKQGRASRQAQRADGQGDGKGGAR